MVLEMVGHKGEGCSKRNAAGLDGTRWVEEVIVDMMADREHEADDRGGTQRQDILFLFRDVAFVEEHRWLISRTSSISYWFMDGAGLQRDSLNQLYLDSSSKSEQRAKQEKIARENKGLGRFA